MRRGVRAAALAAAVVTALAGVALVVSRHRAAPPTRDDAPRPSLLLVTIDTLRADRVGVGLTPNLDALAARGTSFVEALSSVPLTLPSHSTILSGLEPTHHGVHDNGTYVFPADRDTLATLLQRQGYATGAFVGAYVLDRRFGLARGFLTYDDAIDRRDSGTSVLESERRGDAVAAVAEQWIARQTGPFFAWVHLYDPHAPYAAPQPQRDRHPGKPYDAEVEFADLCLGRVLDAARRQAGDRLVVAVLADHGESLGEHGEETHGFFLYQSTLRVPLVMAGPGVPSGERRRGPARTADVMPTLLKLASVDVPAGLDGTDALAGGASRESYAETQYPQTLGWAPLHAYRVGALKLIDAPRPELYDLGTDPAEAHDLAASSPADVTRLRGTLAAFRQGERTTASASEPEVAERLRALGYVGNAPPEAGSRSLADPKDRIAVWHRFEQATWAGARGDDAPAVAGFRAVLAEEPQNPTFRRSLAAALRRSGHAAEAASLLARGEGGNDALAWHEQSVAAEEAGRLDDALRAEDRAIALDPGLPELHNHRGVVLARSGRTAPALQAFERATALDPNNGRAWNNRGNALRAAGQRAAAAEAYRTAMRLSPADPDPRNGLGVLAVEQGDPAAAALLFREALALAPAHAESRLNLAVALVGLGQRDEARALLRALLAARPDPDTAGRATALLRDIS
jgi:choline-sulfatase